jgi:AraC family transcriptional regulator
MAGRPWCCPVELRDRLGAATDYLESRLGGEVDLAHATRCSGFSRSHFMRLFQAAVGFSVTEYVRRRRLSRAAEDLAAGRSVLDVAIEWGYGSQAAFTRAFTRTFGLSPAAYARGVRAGRAPVEVLVPYEPRVPFEVRNVGAPVRVERAPMRLVGLSTRSTARRFRSFGSVPCVWDDWFGSERWRPLGASPWSPTYGVSRLDAAGELTYAIGVEHAGPTVPGYRARDVGGGPYAVLAMHGKPVPTAQALILAAYGRWFLDPALRRLPGGWDIERFRPGAEPPPSEMHCELWIPLQP